ncbi:MAG: xanthine dehydrogenase family protein molybdopterin-binding subunit, partial [Armatimonadota bacterium]|nr:xanthine dehydrogenase family protein molybdopterin-binding subunit [Armatimonadota bacterium]
MSEWRVIGYPTPRVDALEIVTGRATYTVDVSLPGMLVGKILRSPLPHARIRHVDTSRALALPGVQAVVTGEDTLKRKYGRFASADEYGLAVDKVRYVGEQVAAVAARDEETALEALQRIRVEYEELPAVFDPGEAMREGAPILHEDVPNNVSYTADFHWGDVEAGFAASDYVREDTFSTPAQVHGSLEPHAAVAQYAGGRLTVWSTTQGPYALRKDLAFTLGLPEGRVRVVKPHMGGGFGGKREMFASDFCAALLAMKTGLPVKIVYTRQEEFIASRQRHPMRITLRTGCRRDGTILAKDCLVVADGGAYNSRGPGVLQYAGTSLASLYRVPNVRYRGYHVYTNKPVGGAFRGYGSLQVRFADESQMDMLAEELGIDPIELRLKNAVRPGDVTASGRRITSCGLRECLEKVREASRWTEKRRAPAPGYGIGVACNDYVSALRSIYEYDCSSALVRLNEDGSVDLFSGAADIGQGADTVLAQIVAEELGVAVEDVHVLAGDTQQAGVLDLGSYASRVTFVAGNAARRAAADARQQLFSHLARHWNVPPDRLALRAGRVVTGPGEERSVTLAEAVRLVLNREGVFLLGRGYYDAPSEKVDYRTGYGNSSPSYSFGAQVAEVQVDSRTGRVQVLRVWSAADCGRVLNPLALTGQAEGSVVCGLGMTLLEDRLVEDGRTLNPGFLEYKMPTCL